MTEYYSESEVLNMLESLGDDNPFLTKKLKEYNLNSGIYLSFLRLAMRSNQFINQSMKFFQRSSLTLFLMYFAMSHFWRDWL